MKYFFVLFAITIAIESKAQLHFDSLKSKTAFFQDTLKEIEHYKIKIFLVNQSDLPCMIPSNHPYIMFFSKESNPVLYYEILYIGNNQIDTLFKNSIEVNSEAITKTTYDILYPGKKIAIDYIPEFKYFRKSGNYQIRFGFHASRLNKCYSDITTEWVKIYVLK